jgi:hypothetical protein
MAEHSHKIHAVFRDDADTGYLYTVGLETEFLCLGVPRRKLNHVAFLLNFLSDRDVKDNQNCHCDTLVLRSKEVSGVKMLKYLNDYMTACAKNQRKIMLLEPLFQDCHLDDESWGGYPVAPGDGSNQMVASIIDKWMEQWMFVRTGVQDGNPTNFSPSNCTFVTLEEALRHPDWKVDWDMNLSAEEAEYVQNHMTYFLAIIEELGTQG